MEGSVASKSTTELSVELGETYTDSITGFEGIATSCLLQLHGPEMVHLENETASRWIEVERVSNGDGGNDSPI